ncbi:MAG: carbohydrate kinase family protein [Candidatus Zixiibacteriota bacterium]|nr:MAG: carbohydrate kinase family protein [candidate division Zixibacteria bacterium]
MRRFKVAVIGTINKDTIIFPSGRRTESFGGILYSVSALSGLGAEGLEIYPVCNVGHDIHHRVREILEGYDNVKLDGVKKVRRKNNHALLRIDQEGERHETLTNRVPVLDFSQAEPFLDSDAILVNFISGFDISLSTLRRIRRKTGALIFMDVHSLTLGIRPDGRRFLRMPGNWGEYIRQADLVQANVAEWGVLAGKDLTSSADIRDFGVYIMGLGPKALLLTTGREGAIMVYRRGASCRLRKARGIRVRGFRDSTGAGDAFSAGFLASYLRTKNPTLSLDFANRVAVQTCKTSGVEEVAGLVRKYAHRRL